MSAHFTGITFTGAPPPAGAVWTNIVNTDFTGTTSTLPAPWAKYGPFGTNYNGVNPASYYLPAHAFIENVDVGTDACVLLFQYEASGPAVGGNYGAGGAGWYSATIYASAGLGFPTNVIDHRTTFRMRIRKNTILGAHRNLPLYWGVSNDNYWINGEEDYFEIDPAWAAPDGAGKELSRAFWHYSPNQTQANWTFVDEVNAYKRIDLTVWHTYRIQKLNKLISWYLDDMVIPLWSHQYGSGSGTSGTSPLVDMPKNPRFQQEQPNNSIPPAGTVGYERIEIDYIQVDVPA
jgi:hypothetical protein